MVLHDQLDRLTDLRVDAQATADVPDLQAMSQALLGEGVPDVWMPQLLEGAGTIRPAIEMPELVIDAVPAHRAAWLALLGLAHPVPNDPDMYGYPHLRFTSAELMAAFRTALQAEMARDHRVACIQQGVRGLIGAGAIVGAAIGAFFFPWWAMFGAAGLLLGALVAHAWRHRNPLFTRHNDERVMWAKTLTETLVSAKLRTKDLRKAQAFPELAAMLQTWQNSPTGLTRLDREELAYRYRELRKAAKRQRKADALAAIVAGKAITLRRGGHL